MIWAIAWLFVLLIALAVQSHRQYMRQYREIIRLENNIISLQHYRDRLISKLEKDPERRAEDILREIYRENQEALYDKHFVRQVRDNFFLNSPVWDKMKEFHDREVACAENDARDTMGADLFGPPGD